MCNKETDKISPKIFYCSPLLRTFSGFLESSLEGDKSGESWRLFLGGGMSGESCLVFLTGDSCFLPFDDSFGGLWGILLDATSSLSSSSSSSSSSFSSAKGQKTLNDDLVYHKNKFSLVRLHLPPITFHLLPTLKISICFTSSGRSSMNSAI